MAKARRSTRRVKKRPRYRIGRGGGIVASRPRAVPAAPSKPDRTPGGAARSHQVKFSGPNDTVNATATYDNGTILYTAQLRLIFWGREWSILPPVAMGVVVGDVQSIVTGPYLDALTQYGISRVYVDRVIDFTHEDPPNPFGNGDVHDPVSRLIDDSQVPEPEEDTVPAVYVVFLPANARGKSLTLPPDLTGRHDTMLNVDWDDFIYNNVPIIWVGNDGTRGSISESFSHELVEVLTDPEGDGWQVEPRSRFDWNEICDVCSSTYLLNGVVVRSYWSNADNACVVSDQSFTTYTVQWIWRPHRIEWLGGIDEDGLPWQLPRQGVMDRVRGGDQFQVLGGTSGKTSTVGIYYLDATHPYLATNTDGVPDDNLLALPQRPPS